MARELICRQLSNLMLLVTRLVRQMPHMTKQPQSLHKRKMLVLRFLEPLNRSKMVAGGRVTELLRMNHP
jgi:hypothetical protein